MTFCNIVGQASFHTARWIGPSTIDRSNFLLGAGGRIVGFFYYYDPV
jgi:hypothetical protein